jgi:hypothetical protein
VAGVFVRTSNFRLAYRLLQVLESKGVSPAFLDVNDPLPDHEGWWFGTPEEVANAPVSGGRGVAVTVDTVHESVEAWWRSYRLRPTIQRLLVGIDPGPRPGCAWYGDDVLLGKRSFDGCDAALQHVRAMVDVHGPVDVLVRVGNGAPVQRDRLINAALRRRWRVEVVDERRTSRGGSRHEHEASATKIAQKSGQPVVELRTLSPTDGEIRDLQQRSRRASQGAITISAALATEVCTGRMTMAEALLASGYSSSPTRTAD